MGTSSGYIYAFGAVGESYVKVGSTRQSVRQRMKALQVGLPYELEVVASAYVEHDVRQMEREIHQLLALERRPLTGEWFDGPIDDTFLADLVLRAREIVDARSLGSVDAPVRPVSLFLLAMGQRILLTRRARGLSQKQLAALASTPWQVISRVERGHQSMYAERLAAIAQGLGVTSDYLLGLAEEKEKR